MSWPLACVSVMALAVAALSLLGQPRASALTEARPRGTGLGLPLAPAGLLGVVTGAALGWVAVGGVMGIGAGAGVGLGVALWLAKQPSDKLKEQRAMAAQFPHVLNFLAAVVESGAPVRFAAEAVAAVADDANAARLRSVLNHCSVGFSDAEAWRTLVDDPVWGDVARELARCVDKGAAVADVLRTSATQSAKASAAAAMTQARAIGVSSTLPLVCCFLPAFLLVGVVPIVGGLIGGYLG